MASVLSLEIELCLKPVLPAFDWIIHNSIMPNSNKQIEKKFTDFWLNRWEEGDIAWHHDEVNEYLLSHWCRLDAPTDSRVFVPLCGKSLDMVWLAQQGHSVVGVELSSKAIDEFFSEQNLIPTYEKTESFQVFQAKTYTLLLGDIFKLTAEYLEGIAAVYDRASLVALNSYQRKLYAKILANVLQKGCSILLVAMDYPQIEMKGPPYSVPEKEVNELFGQDFLLTKLHCQDLLKDTDRYKESGLSRLSEHIYMLQRK